MIAQAYFSGSPMVRVFDRDGRCIADLPMKLPPCDKTADAALKAMKLQRRERWNEGSWISDQWSVTGREAKVRFVR